MATTPVFGWPYQGLLDAPNGPVLGEQLALAIEGTISPLVLGSTRMGCSLRRVAAQTLPDNVLTPVSWDTEDADTHAMFAPTSTAATIPAGGGGIWAISVSIDLPVVPSGSASFATPTINGSSTVAVPFLTNGGNASGTIVRPLNAGDVIGASVTADTVAGTTMTGSIFAYRVAA